MWSEAHHSFYWFGSTWVGFGYRSLSDVYYNQFGANCLKLPHCSLSMSPSIGSGCAWEGPICVDGPASWSSELESDE